MKYLPKGRKQIHVWVTEADYEYLIGLARRDDRSVSDLLRRVIRQLRVNRQSEPQDPRPSLSATS